MSANEVVIIAAVLVFGFSVFQWQRWKRRTRVSEQELKIYKEALYALGFEAANAANAIRANLLGFRDCNKQVEMPEHLDEVATAVQRIAGAVKIAEDPLAWHAQKSKAKNPPGGNT